MGGAALDLNDPRYGVGCRVDSDDPANLPDNPNEYLLDAVVHIATDNMNQGILAITASDGLIPADFEILTFGRPGLFIEFRNEGSGQRRCTNVDGLTVMDLDVAYTDLQEWDVTTASETHSGINAVSESQ